MGNFGIGQAVRRVEDKRFLTGAGQYTDDINKPGQLYLHILHSPHAHADIASIDTTAARAAPGVVGVLTQADLDALKIGDILNLAAPAHKDGRALQVPPRPALARGRVRYVGEPVAAVVADTLANAKDAADLIEVDYKELTAIVDISDAAQPGTVEVHANWVMKPRPPPRLPKRTKL